jgi:Alpha-lytic protease prodomain
VTALAKASLDQGDGRGRTPKAVAAWFVDPDRNSIGVLELKGQAPSAAADRRRRERM